MQLDNAIKSRKSVRLFSDKKPDWRDIIECIDSARYAPMAGNFFTPRFIIVSDEKNIQKLSEAAQQPFLSQCHYVIVVCSYTKLTVNSYGERAQKYLRQQAGAAIQNVLLKFTEEGISSCWVGHSVDSQVRSILKIPEDIDIEALIPIGYSKRESNKKMFKTDLDNIIFFEEYSKKKMKTPKRVDV